MKKRLSPLGKEVKKYLIDHNMTQIEFCRLYDIPRNRMTEIVTGLRTYPKYEAKVKKILGIQETA